MELYLLKFYEITEKLQPDVSKYCSYQTALTFILFSKYTRKAITNVGPKSEPRATPSTYL